jgi:hypothetical protein
MRQLRRLLRPVDDAGVVAGDALATVVLLDAWWAHGVLRPVGNRLISEPVFVSPYLRGCLQEARRAHPGEPIGRPRRGRKA